MSPSSKRSSSGRCSGNWGSRSRWRRRALSNSAPPDYGFFETENAARDAFERRGEGGDFYENAVAVADAKRWGRPLDTRGSGEHERDFENPSYQIHVCLPGDTRTLGCLTDGEEVAAVLRTDQPPTRLSYYEVDLPTIKSGDLEDFKYFYLFFRHEAFLEDAGGDNFDDDVYGESNVFAQELERTCRTTSTRQSRSSQRGFLQYPENDLDEDDLSRIHDSSLIYLYRLIFVLFTLKRRAVSYSTQAMRFTSSPTV